MPNMRLIPLSGLLISYADKAVAGGWNLSEFSRKHVQQSAVSKFFFERILKIGSDGFYKKPDITQ